MVYKSQPWHHFIGDKRGRVITLIESIDSFLDTVSYCYCSILLCCVSRAIDELELYYTYVQEVSHIGTLNYLTVLIAFIF